MAVYSYVIIDKRGKQIKGSLDSESVNDAMDELRQMGNVVVSIDEAGAFSREVKISIFKKKPKPRDMSVFCRQFVSIISAGVPVVTALEMLSEQSENKELSKALAECKKTIEQGETLASAMSAWPGVFPPMLITLVEAGEASGSLEISFTRMAEQFEKEAKLKATVKKATVYPTFLIVVAIIAVSAMLTFVVPSFESMLTDLGTQMPAITKVVLAISRFMQHRWYLVIAAVVAIVLTLRVYAHSPSGKYIIDKLSLSMPLVGSLTTKTASARMSRTLGTLIGAGLPLDDALSIVSNTMTNVLFKNAIIEARDAVRLGSPLAAQFGKDNLFPPLVYHMISIGEETGSLENMLSKLADYYEEEAEGATERLMAALEPALVLVMAVMIGTIIISLVLPMAKMYNSLGSM